MINIESLKDYMYKVSNEEFMELANSIYMITDFICADYPKHREWYFKKHLIGTMKTDERNILFARNPADSSEIIAMACLKRDNEESKICTLYVSDKCRGLGIGTTIIEASMRWLGTTTPLITLAEYKLPMFQPIIDKYGWQLTQTVEGLYNDRHRELCFNGTLTDNNEAQAKKSLIGIAGKTTI